ncbi:hypothetical protein DFH11DRAFT_1828069 [Phellopilus nigrolimitatus]|nr:hypothetical protein DFH11DRAFT_1828069 [Phellopilus nigrolimitatus]
MVVTVDEAYLIGGWMASALWGGYTVLFGASIYFMCTKRRAELRKPTTWLMVLMYCLATAHIFMALRRIILALIILRDVPPGPQAYLFNIGDHLNRVKDIIYITNLLLGDSIIIWRCYVVWGKVPWIIILPIIMLLGEAIAGYGAIAQYFASNPKLEDAIAWGTAMFTVSMATNIIVTSLTAGRIWWLLRPTKGLRNSDGRYIRIVLLVIESGAVIAAAKLCEFVLFRLDPPTPPGQHPMYIVFEMMPQITVRIMPTLIIVVVNAGLTSTTTYVSGGVAPSSSAPPAKIMFRTPRSRFGDTTTGINSATEVDTELDSSFSRRKSGDNGAKRVDVHLGPLGASVDEGELKETPSRMSFSSSLSRAEMGMEADLPKRAI